MNRDNLEELTVEDYVRMVESGEPFAQANYGDGEWSCLLGSRGRNVNGERYTQGLSVALRRTLSAPEDYLYGTNPGRRVERAAAGYVRRHGVRGVRWVWKDTLSGANVRGVIGPLFRALRERPLILVGPPWLAEIPRDLLPAFAHLEVHESRAYEQAEEVTSSLKAAAQAGTVVLFSAGMGSNLMIYDLWPWAKDLGVSLLDVGAIFDPYTGRLTRKHYKRRMWWAVARPRVLAEAQGQAVPYHPRAYWDARAYDQGPAYVGPGSNPEKSEAEGREISKALTAALRPYRRFQNLLDFGCGSGRLYPALSRASISYQGVDLSLPGIMQAQKRFPRGSFTHLEENRLPFQDGTFDAAVASLVFQHVPDVELGTWARELRRVLRPEAPLFMVDEEPRDGTVYAPHVHPRTPGALAKVLGMDVWVVEHLETGHWLGLVQ